MGYDFFADFALSDNEENIDNVANEQNEFALLKGTDWTIKSQILATGLIFQEKKYAPFSFKNNQKVYSKSLADLIKDGRPQKTAIGGYPQLIKNYFHTEFFDLSSLCKPDPECLTYLPKGSGLIQVDVRLNRPFASRDDRAFYPQENPLKREWLLHTPYLAASGLKGLLRWAWRMQYGEKQILEKDLFGPDNENIKDGEGLQGCLFTWPVIWKGGIGLEVINPHERDTGAGTIPIKYEVVKAGATAQLHFLFFNRLMEEPVAFLKERLPFFLKALELLLTDGGISAKRSSDWGSVNVTNIKARVSGLANASFQTDPGPDPLDKKTDMDLIWAEVIDSQGQLLPLTPEIFTAKRIVALTGRSEKQVRGKHREDALRDVEKRFFEYCREKESSLAQPQQASPAPQPKPLELYDTSVTGLIEKLNKVFMEGNP
jgi:hypothetical protein